jgi:hypothetical protein
VVDFVNHAEGVEKAEEVVDFAPWQEEAGACGRGWADGRCACGRSTGASR